jgi:hypothetical protein
MTYWFCNCNADGELEGGTQKRATNPTLSLTIHTISSAARQVNKPILYYLIDGPACS